jgi:hypothetical protein
VKPKLEEILAAAVEQITLAGFEIKEVPALQVNVGAAHVGTQHWATVHPLTQPVLAASERST